VSEYLVVNDKSVILEPGEILLCCRDSTGAEFVTGNFYIGVDCDPQYYKIKLTDGEFHSGWLKHRFDVVRKYAPPVEEEEDLYCSGDPEYCEACEDVCAFTEEDTWRRDSNYYIVDSEAFQYPAVFITHDAAREFADHQLIKNGVSDVNIIEVDSLGENRTENSFLTKPEKDEDTFLKDVLSTITLANMYLSEAIKNMGGE
jgi:hypothetical protein